MGQAFYFSLYNDKLNKYLNYHPLFHKLGEIAYNEHHLWGYIKNNPLRVGYIGDDCDRFSKYSDEDGYDYGVASKDILFQSDCAGILEFDSELPEFNWKGYLVNYTQEIYVDVEKYYERSNICNNCIDPLVVLAASNNATSLFWDGFSENSAYSILGNWFSDIIEWSDERPKNMNELCDLEFREFLWSAMLKEWGTTEDGYIADKNGEIFFVRRNLGLFDIKISPVKIKYKITRTDTQTYCKSEFVPDDGVTLVFEENNKVVFHDSSGNSFTNYKREWLGSTFLKRYDGL